MPKENLTAQSIKTLPPGEYYDTNPKGRRLLLRVLKSDKRRWEFRYRFAGTYRRFKIGYYPDVSLSDARDELIELKAKLRKGTCPQTEKEEKEKMALLEKQRAQREKTFRQLAEDYQRRGKFQSLRAASREEYERIIKQELLPEFGDMAIKDVTTKDVQSHLDTKPPVMANRIRARMYSIFEFAVGRYLEDNPVTNTEKHEEESADRYFSDKEIQDIWGAFEELSDPVRSYMKALALTGQRRSETLAMRWDRIRFREDRDEKENITFKGYVWVIPAKLSKSKREHFVPLSEDVLAIIESLPKIYGNPYIFAGQNGHISISTVKRAVQSVKKAVSDFKIHHLRRTAATYMAEMAVPQMVVDKILNHRKGGGASAVSRIYNRYEYLKERQRALRRWANKVQEILSGQEEKEATITPITG